jgi:hypothetical protein
MSEAEQPKRRGRPPNPNRPPAPPKRPTAGRPPVDGHKPLPSQIEGLRLASTLLKVPAALLVTAKQKGCPAFMRNNRINTAVLVPWLFDMLLSSPDIEENMRPQDQLALTRAKREKIKLDMDKKVTMPVADAEREAAEAMAYVFEELERMDRELPPSVAGCTDIQVGVIMHENTEKIRNTLKEKFEKIGTGKYSIKTSS